VRGNDLDNQPTPRYYVMADVVFEKREYTEEATTGRWVKRTKKRTVVTWIPNLRALSELWNFSERLGVRLELVFVEGLFKDGPELWELLDVGAANPFNDWHAFENVNKIITLIPYRPDLKGVIDLPDRAGLWGGKGLTLGSLR
jgi:hypothetical protein